MSLQDYRDRIAQIDDQMLELFSERMETAAKIGAYKKENGLPVHVPEVEKKKILKVIEESPEQLKEYSPLLFSLLFELSRSYQNRLNGSSSELTEKIQNAVEGTEKLFPDSPTVACQGVPGAYSQAACERLFRYPKTMFVSSFEAVFSAIEAGLCEYGVLPIENSSAGSVQNVYDLMMKHKFYIVRSCRVKVSHNLLVKPGTKLENVKEIYSHEQAISQCSHFLASLSGVSVIPCENTAVAAKKVADSDRTDIAALASDQCIALYGLECLQPSVQNTGNNYTRFICISKNLKIFPGADRTSLMMTLPHVQGSLYRTLSRFYALGLNLNKLESRPIPDREFEFMFYFDLDTPVYSPNLIQLIGELPAVCDTFQYLGSYSEVI